MQDLTEGPLGKKILIFSVPLMLSNLLQVLFNMADIAVIGQFAGSLSLGAVGSTATLYYGAKDKDSLSKTIHSAALVSLIMGVLLLVLGVGLSEWMLTMLKTREELLDKAVLYLRIYYLGMPALAIYNFGNAVYSAVGNTKKPLYYLGFSGVLNIILNLFFVIVCHMDVAGVALASIISQYVSAALILQALLRCKDIYALHPGKLRLDPELTKDILKLGMPSGLQNVIFQFANSFVQMGVNSFDATMVAGNSAATNADAMVYDVMAAFYTACGSFMGQNYGAGKKKRVRNSYLISLAYSVFVSVYQRCGSYECRYVPSDNHGIFVLYFGIYGLYHCGGQSHGQEHYTYVHCHHGLLRVPCNLGLHRICLFPYDTVPVSAVCWLSCRKTEEPFFAWCARRCMSLFILCGFGFGGNRNCRVAYRKQMSAFQCNIDDGDQNQLDNDTGEAGYEISGSPGRPAVGTACKDQCAQDTGDHTAAQHGNDQSCIQINNQFTAAKKLHDQTADQTIEPQLDHHDRHISENGHTGKQTGYQRSENAADQTERCSTDQTAQKHGQMHGGEQDTAFGNGVQSHGQNHT